MKLVKETDQIQKKQEVSDEKAEEAIEKLNGAELDGRALVVSKAKSAEDR